MTDCKCDLGNILDEETFNVRVIRELCNINSSVDSSKLIRMVDQTDDGDVQFIRTSDGDFELDGTTPYTPVGTVKPYKRETNTYTELPFCYFDNSPVQLDFKVASTWTKVTISMSYTGTTNNAFIFGARTSANQTADMFYLQTSTSNNRFATRVTSNTLYTYVTLTDRTTIEITPTEINTLSDGVSQTQSLSPTGIPNGNYNLCIGGVLSGTQIATAKLEGYFFGFQVEENGTVIHDIVPVKDASNVVCLYDKVTEQYYYPAQGTLTEYMPIPAQYTQGDYLEMPTTAYINTNVGAIPSTTESEFTCMLNTKSSTRRLYGVRQAIGVTSYNVFSSVGSNGPRWDLLGMPSADVMHNTWNVDTWYTTKVTHDSDGYTTVNVNDGWEEYTGNVQMSSSQLDFIVINSTLDTTTQTIGTGSDAKWRDVIISKWTTEPTAYLKPVYDTINSEAGYFDIMRGLFLGNAGTGTITLGTINSLLLSPNLSLGNISLKPSAGLMSTLSITDEEEEEDRPANLRELVRPLQEQVVEEVEDDS